MRSIRLEMRKIKKLLAKPGVRAALAKSVAGAKDLQDSDDDGLPDVIEGVSGTNSCDEDSDDDGISDGEESFSGSNPDDDSSGEVEIKGTISAKTSDTVTVGSLTFTVVSSSRFKNGASLDDFEVGDSVEVSGKIVSGILNLKKISKEDD